MNYNSLQFSFPENSLSRCLCLSLSMVLVESIPQHMKYKANATLGFPLEKAWKDLISMATDQVDVVSFYWTLTGEDINVNSSSDIPVSCQQKHKQT